MTSLFKIGASPVSTSKKATAPVDHVSRRRNLSLAPSISPGQVPSSRQTSASRIICPAALNDSVQFFANSKTMPAIAHATGQCKQFDFIVIGSGIAGETTRRTMSHKIQLSLSPLSSLSLSGLTYAIKVAEHGTVAVVTKDSANEGCTQYAQGGVCAVLDQLDSVREHVEDTMVAGAFLNDPQAVEVVCREGPARCGVQGLLNTGRPPECP